MLYSAEGSAAPRPPGYRLTTQLLHCNYDGLVGTLTQCDLGTQRPAPAAGVVVQAVGGGDGGGWRHGECEAAGVAAPP